MKVRHETNLTRLHLTMFFIMYRSKILVRVKSMNNEKMELLRLIRNGGSTCNTYVCDTYDHIITYK